LTILLTTQPLLVLASTYFILLTAQSAYSYVRPNPTKNVIKYLNIQKGKKFNM